MATYVNQPLPSYPPPPPYSLDEQPGQVRPSASDSDQDSSNSLQSQSLPRPYNQLRHSSQKSPHEIRQWVQETNYEPPIIGIPYGLEYLTQVNRLIVQKVDSILWTDEWIKHPYILYNQNGQPLFIATEESGSCARKCLANQRGYTFKILDNSGREVMTIRRPFKCCGTLCCSHKTTIEAPPGCAVGYIQQKFGFCKKKLILRSMDHKPQLKIKGPNECSLSFCCCRYTDKIFEVQNLDKERIGEIRKQFTELDCELVQQHDTFAVDFPRDLDVIAKASLLCATFLINFLCFEEKSPILNPQKCLRNTHRILRILRHFAR